MQIEHLKNFITIAENGSISNAAKELYISQQALSFSLQTLEKQVGKPLFDRLPRGVRLTKAGEIFLNASKIIINEYESAINSIHILDTQTHNLEGKLNIYAAFGFFHSALPPIISIFNDIYPKVQISSVSLESENILEICQTNRQKNHIFVFSLSTETKELLNHIPKSEFNLFTIWEGHSSYVIHNSHPLATKEHCTVTEIRQYPHIMFTNNYDISLDNFVITFDNLSNLETTSSIDIFLNRLNKTPTIGIISDLILSEYSILSKKFYQINTLPCEELLKVTFVLAYPKDCSTEVSAFVSLVENYMKDSNENTYLHKTN